MYIFPKYVNNIYINYICRRYKLNTNNIKNIVIVKNLPSNLVEEAIIVVKNKNASKAYIDKKKNENKDIISGYIKEDEFKKIKQIKQDTRSYVVKEAEMIIKSYLEKMEYNKKLKDRNLIEEKYTRLKYFNCVLVIMSLLSTLICVIK